MTSNIIVSDSRELFDSENVAAQVSIMPNGNYVPYGLSGVIVDECTVLCPECATDCAIENGSPIIGDSEWD